MAAVAPPPDSNSGTSFPFSADLFRLTVDEYEQMIDAGILGGDDRVELLEGCLVNKMAHNPLHDGTIQLCAKRLSRRVPAGWEFRVQSSLKLSDSTPEPDLVIVRGDETTYLNRHPTSADAALVVEVCESSIERDRTEKARIYARSNVVVYWVIDLIHRQIEVFTHPSGPTDHPTFGHCQVFRPGDEVPLSLDGTAVAAVPVSELLPAV